MVRMLEAIDADVNVCVKSSEGLSEIMSCPLGAKLCCIIVQVLFTLFLNDLRDAIAEGNHNIDVETISLFVLLLSDGVMSFA